MTLANFDKIQAVIDVEIQAAYNRGLAKGLQHFDRLRCWLSAKPFRLGEIRHIANQEADYIARQYPQLERPSDYLI